MIANNVHVQQVVAIDKLMQTMLQATTHTKLLNKTIDFHYNFVIHANVIDNIVHVPHSVAIDNWMQTIMLATAHTKLLKITIDVHCIGLVLEDK